MTTQIAINGFGRIGRLLARLILEQRPAGIELAAINDMMDPRSCAALYKRDSVHGPASGQVEFGDGWIMVDGRRIAVTVRRQNIWHRSRRKLAECGPRLLLGFRRRAYGVASADVQWSVA